MIPHAILKGHEALSVTPMEAVIWSAHSNVDRRVAETYVGDVQVSTVFVVVGHGGGPDGIPRHFETMVRGGVLDGHGDYSVTWEDAERGHALWVARVREESTL